jgi:LysR family glycine cleavage system transcriptional activator
MQATAGLEPALHDLRTAFAALDRVSDALAFQRQTEIHIVADPDWSELWLLPRLDRFRAASPNVHFCINGVGDVPLRLGAPDLRIQRGGDEAGEELFTDWFVPLVTPPNMFRIAGRPPETRLDGMPLIHVAAPPSGPASPTWPDWFAAHGGREEGLDRGAQFRHMRDALDALRVDTGFLLGGLSLVLDEVESGDFIIPFPPAQGLPAPAPYRLKLRAEALRLPQHRRFRDWLMAEAAATRTRLAALAA